MSEAFLGDRRKSLEEAFFAKQQADLLQKLQEEQSAQTRRESLRAASGITDEAVLDQLAALDIQSETVAAVALVPLVAVAWADKSLDDKERTAILSGAQQSGLDAGHPSYQLLEGWLTDPPEPLLVETWKRYIGALLPTLSPDAGQSLKQDVLGRARAVAEASGGFLGLGSKISRAEQEVLDDLEQAF
ncbi:MAG: hypothetical protein ETSY1_03940 [Candidatus Entotheonella factor]|uniref:TerB family tellurite resistance protein n=1 Tax=Entotheonella factor TaxID=1429438 RepID=W4LW68_ENTF1|nr:hypothetical protein [Candidatus Entotheonella palauensis]ETX02334.1 MAG: hypothetical protein ETSY1_03940 [Candidatus Entotheonella factor]